MIDPNSLINYTFTNFSDEDLHALSKKIEEEIEQRRLKEVTARIQNFEAAFRALQDAGIEVHVTDCDDEIDYRIRSKDDFYYM